MAGLVKSRKLIRQYLSFWHFFIFSSFFIILLTGCTRPRANGSFAVTVPPEQKKVELQEKLKHKFEDPQTHFLLGQLYHAEKAWDDAEYEYNMALRFDPVYRPAQAAMVKLLMDRGDKLKAQHYFDTYMNQVSDSPDKLIELATELQQQQLDTYALDCYQKALKIAPNSAKVYKSLGYFYLSRNDKDKARESFETSFKLDGNQPDVARELGKLSVPIVYDGKPGKIASKE
jgi:Tfp pilus assembly protein PilF